MNQLSKILAFTAIVSTGLSAGVAFAHLLELPNKMSLSAENYLWVQQRLYEGFGQVLGPIEVVAFLSAISVTVLLRKQRHSFRWSLLASVCISLALIVWQLHNGPVNISVETWTIDNLPANWMTYRDRWEYAHAVRAGLYTLALSTLTLATLSLSAVKKVEHGLFIKQTSHEEKNYDIP